jgi:hypothetical protein
LTAKALSLPRPIWSGMYSVFQFAQKSNCYNRGGCLGCDREAGLSLTQIGQGEAWGLTEVDEVRWDLEQRTGGMSIWVTGSKTSSIRGRLIPVETQHSRGRGFPKRVAGAWRRLLHQAPVLPNLVPVHWPTLLVFSCANSRGWGEPVCSRKGALPRARGPALTPGLSCFNHR